MSNLVTLLSLTEVWVGLLGLASFLTLFWVLRGAPIGQAVRVEEDVDAPRGGYRDRVVAAVAVGMTLIVFGGYIAITQGVKWSLPAFALGFGTVLALVLMNQRYRHGSPTMRRTVGFATAALNATLFAGILIVVNVIAFRYGGRAIDMTREGTFTLESLTVNQLRTLQRPVTFTTFFGRSGAAIQQRDMVQQLLELYRAVNPEKIRLDHVDPDRDLARYEALVNRVQDVGATQGGGVVIEYGEGDAADRFVVRNSDLFDIPRASRFDPEAERFESVFKGEAAITSALMRLREGKKTRVVFLTGHGEQAIDDTDATKPGGLGLWKARLTATGCEVVEVNLLTQSLPEDTAVVIVAGPKDPFRPDEAARLESYVEHKGPLMVLLSDVETTGLEGLLEKFDVKLGRGLVVEPRLCWNGKVEYLVAPVARQEHPILDSLRNQVLLIVRAQPIVTSPANANPKAAATLVSTPLVRTSPQSWAEVDRNSTRAQRDENDQGGPFTLAVAVSDRPAPGDSKAGTPRIVAVSSRYFADNGMVQMFPSNLDFLMNSLNWLRGREDFTGIAPRTHASLTLTADPLLRARLVMVPTVLAVLLIITLGVVTYLARRA